MRRLVLSCVNPEYQEGITLKNELLLFFKRKTAYEMRISDWSSDVCSSDLDTSTPTTRPFSLRTKRRARVEVRIRTPRRRAAFSSFDTNSAPPPMPPGS